MVTRLYRGRDGHRTTSMARDQEPNCRYVPCSIWGGGGDNPGDTFDRGTVLRCDCLAQVYFLVVSLCVSPKGKNFLTWCFKRDPNDRATTKYLLEHPFSKSADDYGKSPMGKGKAPPPPPKRQLGRGVPLDLGTIVGGVGLPTFDPSKPTSPPMAGPGGVTGPGGWYDVGGRRNKVSSDHAAALLGSKTPRHDSP